MSLVVAKIINGKIQIESDTKISGENVVRNNPINGRLKALILARDLVLCYAGDVALAEDAYNFFVDKARVKIIWQDYLNYLNELSKTDKVDFILAGYSTGPFIVKISRGSSEQSESAWIGDNNAFSEFQKHFNKSDNWSSLEDQFHQAFRSVINNQLNSSVGEFHVTIKTNLNDFQYGNRTVPVLQYFLKGEMILGRSKNIKIQKKGDFVRMAPLKSDEGDFSISYFKNPTQEKASLGIYFEQGQFGLFYCSGRLLICEKYDVPTAQEFVNSVFKNTGVELHGMLVLKDSFGFKLVTPEK